MAFPDSLIDDADILVEAEDAACQEERLGHVVKQAGGYVIDVDDLIGHQCNAAHDEQHRTGVLRCFETCVFHGIRRLGYIVQRYEKNPRYASIKESFCLNNLEYSKILRIFAIVFKNHHMESTALNEAQMSILRLLGSMKTTEEVNELRQVICDYYARRVDDEVDKLWDSGQWNNEKNEAILGEHLRTPYHKQ